MKQDGKRKLLVLGSNVGSVDIVKYAKKRGIYTVVADYYPPQKSEAKQVADESIMVSTADLEALSKVIEEYHINGILAGISEFNLLNAQKLAEKYNLPFYCTPEQWKQIEHKDLFRSLCEENGVPCPKTFFRGSHISTTLWERLIYPLVVKPVDASISQGVFICKNEEELKNRYKQSIEVSDRGDIIIEEFVEGEEFTAHYTIYNGKASLSCVDNRYPISVHEGSVTTIPAARIYPSTFTDEYIKQVNNSMIQLCEGLGIRDAVLFIQGIYNSEKNQFWIFEGGLRSAGEAPYRFLSVVNGVDYLHMLVDQALHIPSSFRQEKEDPYLKGKCCGVVSLVARTGVVASICGLKETVDTLSSIVDYECRYPEGSQIPDTDTLRQLMIRFVMICDNREQMLKDIEYINSHIEVLDPEGKSLILRLSPEIIMREK